MAGSGMNKTAGTRQPVQTLHTQMQTVNSRNYVFLLFFSTRKGNVQQAINNQIFYGVGCMQIC